jgi:hypothetical protein
LNTKLAVLSNWGGHTLKTYRVNRTAILDYFGPLLARNSAATVNHLYR